MEQQPIRQFHAKVKGEVVAKAVAEGLTQLRRLVSSTMPVGEHQERLARMLEEGNEVAEGVRGALEVNEQVEREAEAELLQREADVEAAERAAARGRS
jgi:hypothetical protein